MHPVGLVEAMISSMTIRFAGPVRLLRSASGHDGA